MEAIFLSLLNTSVSASWLILAVIILRQLLQKTPKWIICLLWAVVAFRLLCPISIESPIAVIPESNITQELVDANIPGIAIPQFDAAPVAQNMDLIHVQIPTREVSSTEIATVVWIVGVFCMMIYLLISYLRLHYQVREAAILFGNIWLCDAVRSPFILGIIKPKIYLPSSISEKDVVHVVAHESAHLKRKDHWWKPLGYILLAVFWFNPLMWVAYILMCRDIEIACDEKVIRNFGLPEKKAYSEALMECSNLRKLVIACPVAFGETAVLQRIRNVLNYKKPHFWIVLISIIVLVLIAVVSLTVPEKASPQEAMLPTNEEIIISTMPVQESLDPTIPTATTEGNPDTDQIWSEYPDGVRIEPVTGEYFTGHVMIVRDPSKVYLATSSEKLSMDIPGAYMEDVLEREQAVAAINAGNYYDDGSSGSVVGSVPCGMVVRNGEIVWDGVGDFQPYTSFVGFDQNNVLVVASAMNPELVSELKIRDGCIAGPLLIVNGQADTQVYNSNSGYNPRTAIGQCADGSVVFVCIDGRITESLGATYGEVIDILLEYGVVNACALQGGNSTAMLYRDTYGQYGEKETIQMITELRLNQTRIPPMPAFWMVQPAE